MFELRISSCAGRVLNSAVQWKEKNRQFPSYLIGLVGLAIGLSLTLVLLSLSGWNPLSFAHIGTFWAEGVPYPEGTNGYDGQFFYQIAIHGKDAVPYLDFPSYRYMRILYPVLARLISFGQPALIPWMLIAINLLAFSMGTLIFTRILIQMDVSPIYGLSFSFWVGTIICLLMDLCELLSLALGLWALWSYLKGKVWMTVPVLIFAILAKDMALIIALTLALDAVLIRRDFFRGFMIALVPLGVLLAWAHSLSSWLGRFPTQYQGVSLRFPLMGFFEVLQVNWIVFLLELAWIVLPLILLSVLSLMNIIMRRRLDLTTFLVIIAIGFMTVLPTASWMDPASALRLSIPLVIAGILFLAENYPRFLRFASGLWVSAAVLLLFLVPQMI